jgi:hypothetical protein
MKIKAQAKKLPKGVTQEFVDNIQAMTTDQLKAQIVLLQIQNQENEAFKESEDVVKAEQVFTDAKTKHNYVVGPIKEVTVSIKNRTKLVIDRLKEKGGA